ncbi:MAG: prolyl oligopeptidase family serine peptidase [Bacteroidota bacterium]
MLTYPPTKKVDQIDDYYGTQVKDPYRWLEDDRSPETEAWVKAQNSVSFAYLNQIPTRAAFRQRLEELFNYPRMSSPRKVGAYYFFYKNDGLQNQDIIYIQHGLEGTHEVFIDPNKLSDQGTVSISLLSASQDNRYIAYSRSEAGSDWQEIRIIDIESRQELSDHISWVKFSGTAWYQDGFFYSRYPAPKAGKEFSESSDFQKVYYHRLGTSQEEDQLIYEDLSQPNMYHSVGLTEDKAYLILYKSSGTDGFETWYKKTNIEPGGFRILQADFQNKSSVIAHKDGSFLVLTDKDAPNYRLVSVPVDNPSYESWEDILPEKKFPLQNVSKAGGKLFASYLESAFSHIYQCEYDGSNLQEISLPAPGTATLVGGKKDQQAIFYSFSSFSYPPTIYRYTIASGKSELFFQPELSFEPADFETKQVWYTSKDGTKISMFVVHKKGLTLAGDHPTYLYGYGGFNIPLTPGFSASIIPLLENDGIYAMPNLRGGSEYGEEWHRGGMLEKKQNVFDDFIAAGEYLIAEGYTNRNRLAIAGGSNGGLLVGACMNQRPDLFQVCMPAVGVMDMLRYHLFTVGWGWVPEYGSAENGEAEFNTLFAYSPLHNLVDGTDYPATMVTTADHDDRVVPAHSFKYAARLQEAHKGTSPVIIRIEVDAGHGAGKPISKILDEQADKWSFMFDNMGISELSAY